MNADSQSLQGKMDAAFDNYFKLSELLRLDLNTLLDVDSNSEYWRRNFIRITASLIEGHAHCLREVCSVGKNCIAPSISKKEISVIDDEANSDTATRIKLTLRAAYKLFDLSPFPDFSTKEWGDAKDLINKRHALMHPKTPEDLQISDTDWDSFYAGALWLMRQIFDFSLLLHQKYASSESSS